MIHVHWWSAPGSRFVLESTQDAVVVVDADGLVVHANRAAGRLVGLPDGGLVGRPAAEVFVPNDGSQVLARALRGVHVRSGQTTLRRADGTGTPVQVEGGHAGDHVVLVLRDETERVDTQMALADAQQRLRDLQSLGRVGLWRWVPSTDEVQWSDQLYRIHDLDPLDSGGTLRDHLGPIREDVRDQVRAAMAEAVRSATGFEAEYVVVRRDGEERWIYSRADPLVDDREQVLALTGIAQDVTADRRARAEAETARARLDRFASVLAHDLRAPLSTVAAFAEVLLRPGLSDQERDTIIGRVHHNTVRAIELVDGVLAETRGGGDEVSDEVDLAAVVAWVLDTLEGQLTRTGSSVAVGDLPRVEGREPLLRQAVLNLVGNAVKYRPSDRGARIEVRAVRAGDHVELQVDDDGPGIPPELREAVLADGYRAERDRRRGIEGTGIGLATVQDIARRHGTTLTVGDSDLGGARFSLRLRRVADA